MVVAPGGFRYARAVRPQTVVFVEPPYMPADVRVGARDWLAMSPEPAGA